MSQQQRHGGSPQRRGGRRGAQRTTATLGSPQRTQSTQRTARGWRGWGRSTGLTALSLSKGCSVSSAPSELGLKRQSISSEEPSRLRSCGASPRQAAPLAASPRALLEAAGSHRILPLRGILGGGSMAEPCSGRDLAGASGRCGQDGSRALVPGLRPERSAAPPRSSLSSVSPSILLRAVRLSNGSVSSVVKSAVVIGVNRRLSAVTS